MIVARKEYFGGIIFNTDTHTMFELDEELFSYLYKIRASSPKSIKKDKYIKSLKNENLFTDYDDIFKIKYLENISNNLSAPLQIYVSISSKCNLKCKHCFNIRTISTENEIMTIDVFKKVIDIVKKYGIFQLKITGGEPLLNPNFEYFIDLLESEQISYVVYTNGTLLNDNIINKLGYLKYLKKLKISLDGDKKINNDIRRMDVFDEILKKCKQLPDELFEINYTINNKNYFCIEQLKNDISFYKVNSVLDFGIIRITPFLLKNQNELLFKKEKINDVIDSLKKQKILKKKKPSLTNDFKYVEKFGCPAGQVSCSVSTNGDVFPCTLFYGNDLMFSGNIMCDDFEEIWHSRVNTKLRNLNAPHTCKNCDFFITKKCNGGCRANALFYNFSIEGIDPFCELYKKMIE